MYFWPLKLDIQLATHVQVRGAPAIGVVGSLSLAAEIYNQSFGSNEDLLAFVSEKLDYLVTARFEPCLNVVIHVKQCQLPAIYM